MTEQEKQMEQEDDKALAVSIAGLCFPFIVAAQSMLTHDYSAEPYTFGCFLIWLFAGCVPGSLLGAIALIMNRGQKKSLVRLLGILPVVFLCIGILLLVLTDSVQTNMP